MENKIELKIGDEVRWSGRRNTEKIVHEFEYEGKKMFVVEVKHSGYNDLELRNAEIMSCVREVCRSGSYWDGIVEVNGKKVRGTGGILLEEPKESKKKDIDAAVKSEDVTKYGVFEVTKKDFESFVRVQRSGVINMMDIRTGSRLARISEDKYTDIMWNYKKYQEIFKK